FVAGTHSKVYCQWLFPDMSLIWKHLDDISPDGFYCKLGLTFREEKERRSRIDEKMQALGTDLLAKIKGKVKEIAGVVLHSKTVLSESQPSDPDTDEEMDDDYFERYMES